MTAAKNESEFMTRDEVARRLRVSVRTIDRMIQEDELRTKKSRHRRLIYRISVDAYLETCCD